MDSFFDGLAARWPAGQADFHWHVLFDPDLTRRALTEPYRELTHRGGLAPVEPQWLHLTLSHSGPVAEISDEEIARAAERVRARCAAVPASEITLGVAVVGPVGIGCAGAPDGGVRGLWQLVGQASEEVLGGRFPRRPAVFVPHVALAYATGRVDEAPLRAWLAGRDLAPVVLPVAAVSLVAQWHDMRFITWRHILDIPLAGRSSV